MDGLQFITSNPVRDGRRQAFSEAVARQTFEDSQADREIAADERARLATERENKAALDEAYRSIAAGQATGDTMQDELARSVAAIPGGGTASLEAIQARDAAAAAQAAAEQERADLERKRSDKLAELAADRGFQLLDLGAVAEAKASFESAGMKFPEQFYVDRGMQARTKLALKTAKQFYEHDPQNAAKFTASVMQGMSVDEAVQKFPPMQKSPGGATTYRDVVMPDGTIQTIAIAPGSTEGVPVTAGGQNVTPVPRTTPARARTQDFTVLLSDGSQATVPGQVIDGKFHPTLSNGYLGVSFDAGGDPSKIAEVYQRFGIPMPPDVAPPPVAPEKPGVISRTWDYIFGNGSEPQTATATPQSPPITRLPGGAGIEGVNAGQPAPVAGPATLPPLTSETAGQTGDGRTLYRNQDGSVSSERSITVTDPRLNGGRPTNIPSMFNGRQVEQNEAIDIIVRNGGIDPETGRRLESYNTIDEAVAAAKSRSAGLGTGAPAPVTSPSNTSPGEPVVTTEGLRFPDGEVVPIGGMIYQGGKRFIVQSITPDPATGELIVNVTPTGQ